LSTAPDSHPTDVRTRILLEATRLFAERGYNGTSIQMISQAAGIKRPTLVYHFGSKDSLREAVLGQLVKHWQAELPRLMAAASDGGPRLDSLMRALFQFFLEDRNRARLVLREMLDAPDSLTVELRRELQPWTQLLVDAMRTAQGQGVIRHDVDIESFLLLIITTSIGVLAIGDRTKALVPPEPGIDDQLMELIRIAKTSLFTPRES